MADLQTEGWKNRISGNWQEMKGALKKQYADLTDDDLMYREGQEDELRGRIQQRLGMTQQEADTLLNKI